MNSLTLEPIATLRSPLRQKFGTPRQPRLVTELTATVELLPPYNCSDAFTGLEQFSHIWLLFSFHQ
ncbi:MAG: SAM-dependent methyltransferase, partial [Gammaproteobacteria bacterium]|nr:SAM-dependent methyltransferase [Gammaproteobacteria bacterium]